ncbi:predicted protein [Naegleria gruberi]|uniref:Predicted protein n=1 Tax=Naegleria gruberi TaxID=5762 RepID=D2VJ94_NAEGR|nr:uncharacterized protein NAEGRDRAFT_68955 [Naegleria gruberi]EFC43243.1 predicted protein [Naegleria gruberi]|eukprot:XP_002675987.1 predicted protein [Naegleria gruberi strain NEG-M]
MQTVGVLKYLVENRPKEETQYNVVTGNSCGSINALSFAQFPIGKEKDAIQFILDKWHSIKSSDVYTEWKPFGLAQGFLYESGLFNTAPLYQYLYQNINDSTLLHTSPIPTSNRYWRIGASNLRKFSYRVFTNDNVKTKKDLIRAIVASSAIPGIFPAVDIDGELYVDGGMKYMTPISDAIEKCKNLTRKVYNNYTSLKSNGDRLSPHEKVQGRITIDVILAINSVPYPKLFEFNTTPFILLETIYNSAMDILLRDLENARLIYKDDPNVQIRAFLPKHWLPGYFIGFNAKEISDMIDKGFSSAQQYFNSTRTEIHIHHK